MNVEKQNAVEVKQFILGTAEPEGKANWFTHDKNEPSEGIYLPLKIDCDVYQKNKFSRYRKSQFMMERKG